MRLKFFITAAILLANEIASSQTITGSNINATKRIQLKTRYITDFTIGFFNIDSSSDLKIPTAKAVANYVNIKVSDRAGLLINNFFTGNNTFNSDITINGLKLGTGPGSGIMNTRFGNSAGNLNTTGSGNTWTGYQAGLSNTTGNYNTGFGLYALPNISASSQNTGVGAFTQFGSTTGYSNTTLGYNTLRVNWSGYENTAIGTSALQSNETGYSNTAIGQESLNANTTGIYNVAGGWFTLKLNTTGSRNSALGSGALSANVTGDRNTAIGFLAGDFVANSSDNTIVGANSMQEALAGNRNTIIGSYAVQLNDYPELVTAIGFEAINGNKHHTDSSIAIGARIGYTGYFTDVNYRHDIIVGNFSGSNKTNDDSTLYNAIMVGNSITNNLDNIAIFGTGSQSVLLGNGGGDNTAMNLTAVKDGALFYNTTSKTYAVNNGSTWNYLARIVPAPASAGATGVAGSIAYDNSYIYVCVATNTWVRAALGTW